MGWLWDTRETWGAFIYTVHLVLYLYPPPHTHTYTKLQFLALYWFAAAIGCVLACKLGYVGMCVCIYMHVYSVGTCVCVCVFSEYLRDCLLGNPTGKQSMHNELKHYWENLERKWKWVIMEEGWVECVLKWESSHFFQEQLNFLHYNFHQYPVVPSKTKLNSIYFTRKIQMETLQLNCSHSFPTFIAW